MNRQQGFGAIVAIVVIVILGVLGSAIVSVGTTQQVTSAQDLLSARAWQAARAGNEWGLYQALHGQDWAGASTTCDTASRAATLNLTADTGFGVTVSCNSWSYSEGETVPGTPRTVIIYSIKAVACPATVCPPLPADSAIVSGMGYVERTRVVIATNTNLRSK
ncbi:MSHA biogenesis protein MshP [Gammaproteobacteria bacterium]